MPSYITTPDTVNTRIGALKFFDWLSTLTFHEASKLFSAAYQRHRSMQFAKGLARLASSATAALEYSRT
jgi:hypothetical protein